MKVCNPLAALTRTGSCRHNHRDANKVLLVLYFNIILSNLWQELCENGEFQWSKLLLVAQVISVLLNMFLRCGLVLKQLLKPWFVFKMK